MSDWTYQCDGLTIRISRTPTGARVEWLGVSDHRSPADFLNPVIKELAVKLPNREVVVDLTGLEYMNSATVKSLIDMIKSLDARGPLVSVVFRDHDWQRTHRNCMVALARTMNNTKVQ